MKDLLDSIKLMIDGALSKAPFDSTRNAIVIAGTNSGKYRVKIDGAEYKLPVHGVSDIKTGDIVKVVIPCNNMNKAWILPKGGVPENPTFESVTIKGHTNPIGYYKSSYATNVNIPEGVKTVAHISTENIGAGVYMIQYMISSSVLTQDVNLNIGFCDASGSMENIDYFSYEVGDVIMLSKNMIIKSDYTRSIAVAIASDSDITLSKVNIQFVRIN